MRLALAVLVLALALLTGGGDGYPGPSNAAADPLGGPAQTQPSAETRTATGGDVSLLDRFTVWVIVKQRELHRELTGYLRDLRNGAGPETAWTLVLASFLYGVFHAAGPGHGKAVMTGFLLTHPGTVRRGIALSAAAAFCQGLVAILIVYGLIGLAGLVPRDTQAAVTWSERASFVLIALVGAMLAFGAARRLARRIWPGTSRTHGHAHGHHHGHHHDHDHDADAACCGHKHVPTAAQVAQVRDLRTALAVVLSIGARPCTGAVIVLVFASVASLDWIGIGAVMAMSAGTAITVAGLAILAVSVRNAAGSLPWAGGRFAGYAGDAAALAGGGFILVLGVSLLVGSGMAARPFL